VHGHAKAGLVIGQGGARELLVRGRRADKAKVTLEVRISSAGARRYLSSANISRTGLRSAFKKAEAVLQRTMRGAKA